jgi:FkbM family methyltransferase
LISVANLEKFWGVRSPSKIIHVGAHEAEELDEYERLQWGLTKVVWVEALPEKKARLDKMLAGRLHHEVHCVAAWNVSGEDLTFRVTSNSQSSSAFPLQDHQLVYPEISVVRTIKMRSTALADLDLWDEQSSDTFLNLDVQGAELNVLQGIGDRVVECQAVYCEVSTRELYQGAPLLSEIDKHMKKHGFSRVDIIVLRGLGWGDALYIKDNRYRFSRYPRRLLRILLTSRALLPIRRIRMAFREAKTTKARLPGTKTEGI